MAAPAEDHPLRPVPRHRYVDFQMAGKGAMGLVYLAHDTELKRNVAFKIVRPQVDRATGEAPTTPLEASASSRDARFAALRARFLQEAWVTGGMEHPGIVPVYEVGQTEGGVPYYTMRFVPGQRTLENALEELRERPLDERLGALEPFLKLCDAVSYAHARGVIHRDLKPANVALGEYGEVVLLDWGLAKARGHATPVGEDVHQIPEPNPDLQTDGLARGTPGYMPPEAVRGGAGEVDDRSDVYGLGAILFRILTGHLPFEPEPFPEYIQALLHEDAPSARSVDPTVPAALDRHCARALRSDPEQRLASARELAEGVRQWQTQSALDREVENLITETERALSAAEGSRGPSRIRQSQRALTALEAARKQKPGSHRLEELQVRARAQRDLGIRETQRAGRQRVLVVGGIALLFLLSIAASIVAALLNEKRKEAEFAKRTTEAALTEATEQREEARRQSAAALAAKRKAELEADKARDANELISALVSGLQGADPQGAGRIEDVLAGALEKAVAQGNADGVFVLLEQAREGRPFARLGVGAAIRGRPVPAALAEAELRARKHTGEMHAASESPGPQPTRDELREQRAALKAFAEARRKHNQILRQIMAALSERVTSALPGPATLEQVRAQLGAREVFVSYGRVKGFALAVVLDRASVQLVPLGETAALDEAVATFQSALHGGAGAAVPLELLRSKLVERLALPGDAGRICIVPDGATFLVPFHLLLPTRDVSIVPSAAAFLHLRALPPTAGSGVLAIADARDERPSRLPGARAEAIAIGTSTLLGEEATRARFAAVLASGAPWRAVHVGLRGVLAGSDASAGHIDLTRGDGEDGYLTAYEIARLDARADLVVLSAASLRGSQGADVPTSLAVPQALLFAGARRVLFSTVVTEDQAARALMIEFYRRWSPRDGSTGVDAATALAQAQAYVRSQEAWKDPANWAGWILWGLQD